MERFIKGDVIILAYQYTNLRGLKSRPGLVLAPTEESEYVVCQITSQPLRTKYSLELSKTDFESGGLTRSSIIRADRILTVEPSVIKSLAGHLKESVVNRVIQMVMGQLSQSIQ